MTATDTTTDIPTDEAVPVKGGPVCIHTPELLAAFRDADLFRWREPGRQYLARVKVQRTDTELIVTATDSFTLLRRRVELSDMSDPGEWTSFVEGGDVRTLLAHLHGEEGPGDDATLSARSVGARWPQLVVTRGDRELVLGVPSDDPPYPETDHFWPNETPALGSARTALNPAKVARLAKLSAAKASRPARFHLAENPLQAVYVLVGERTEVLLMSIRIGEWEAA